MNERKWTGPVRTCTCKPHTDRRHQLGGWCCAIVLSTACAHTCCRQSISMGRLAGWLGPDFLMSLYQSRCGTFPAQGCCCCRKQHCCPVMLMFADVYCLLDYGRSLSLLSPLSCACCCCLSAAALLLLCLTSARFVARVLTPYAHQIRQAYQMRAVKPRALTCAVLEGHWTYCMGPPR
jgi:hypothetical protein